MRVKRPIMQLLLTAKVFERLGVTVTLALLPAFSIIGFLALGFVPMLTVLIVFGVIRRAGEFALRKPAREAKYKAKNVIGIAQVKPLQATVTQCHVEIAYFNQPLSN